MRRADAVLAILASAEGRPLTPVQLQKAAFLLDRNIQGVVSEGQGFNFVPYDYGPFDRAVYDDAVSLAAQGKAAVGQSPYGRWNVYSATDEGIADGNQVLNQMGEELAKYVREVVAWVRAQSFTSLVKSIYNQYPEMKENSIFQD